MTWRRGESNYDAVLIPRNLPILLDSHVALAAPNAVR